MKTDLKQIRQKQISFYKNLLACLRGFTNENIRPLSYRFQFKFTDWKQSYDRAEVLLQKMKTRLQTSDIDQEELNKQIESWKQSQVSI